MWRMGGLGPIAEQNHHFNKYAPLMGEDLTYAKDRYTHETARMYRVLNTQPEQSKYVAGGFFSIADMAIWPWTSLWGARNRHSRINRIWPAGCKPAHRAAALLLAMDCIWTCGQPRNQATETAQISSSRRNNYPGLGPAIGRREEKYNAAPAAPRGRARSVVFFQRIFCQERRLAHKKAE